MPAAIYGGREDVMRRVAPDGPVYQAGTLSGNPLATAAGLATLKILKGDPGIYARLEKKSARLAAGIEAASRGSVKVSQIGSLLGVSFDGDADRRYAEWYSNLLQRGVYVAPSRFEAMFVSDAHTEADIDETLAAAREFFVEEGL